jgi:DNA-binding transcriptional LysR family regulator
MSAGVHGASLDKDHPRIELEQFNMVFRAAIAGLGVAIVPAFLARQDFTSGALVPLFDPLANERRGDLSRLSRRSRELSGGGAVPRLAAGGV